MAHRIHFTASVVAAAVVVTSATTFALAARGYNPLLAQVTRCQAEQDAFVKATYDYMWTYRDDRANRDMAKAAYDQAGKNLQLCYGMTSGDSAPETPARGGSPNNCNALRTRVENLQELLAHGSAEDRQDNNQAYKAAKEELKQCMQNNPGNGGAAGIRGGRGAGDIKAPSSMVGKSFEDCDAMLNDVRATNPGALDSNVNEDSMALRSCFAAAARASEGLSDADVEQMCKRLATIDINQNECDRYNWYQFCSQDAWGGRWTSYFVPTPPPAACTGQGQGVPSQGPNGTQLPRAAHSADPDMTSPGGGAPMNPCADGAAPATPTQPTVRQGPQGGKPAAGSAGSAQQPIRGDIPTGNTGKVPVQRPGVPGGQMPQRPGTAPGSPMMDGGNAPGFLPPGPGMPTEGVIY